MHDHGGGIRCFPAAAVLAAAMLTCAAGDLIKVGDKAGWTPDVNYTHWAAHRHFFVGDWLYFVFDKRYYNVLEVKKANYERCDDGEFMKNVTRGGRDVYNLTEARSYYFLSSGGYCFHGMKLSIHVRRSPPPPPPSPSPDVKSAKGGASPESGRDRAAALFMAVLISIFILRLL
ncbi:early nodulin-like protein 19 [Salvia miltiorrhiza]|uniref:early nodulin-like protein 19 n=1 Tax=Salvia miltiorrhiza TaxID=226208 RepID=UPI0025ABEB5F|nr:early nodulin-like protein 19 [Salvia miltiorrhiza]